MWTGALCAFAKKAFYKNDDSFVIAQREFRREFAIHCNRAVTSAHTVKTWVRSFESTGSTLKKKDGSVNIARTRENIVVVREAIERSPHRSVCRQSVSLGLSEASVRQILQKDLHFYAAKFRLCNI
jgi:transposase